MSGHVDDEVWSSTTLFYVFAPQEVGTTKMDRQETLSIYTLLGGFNLA